MSRGRIVITVNAAWNLVNFRMGLIRALIADGWEMVAVAPEDADARAALEAAGCRFVALAIESKSTSPGDLRILQDYWRLLRRERPDIVLGYTIKPNVYGSLACRLLGIPIINNISGLGTGFMRSGWLNRIVRLLYRRGLAASRRVFFQNVDDRDLFVNLKLVRAEQTGLLPGSGIDLARFAAAPFVARGSGELTFLLIARMLGDKGVREYVGAARIVQRRLAPAARFRLLGFLDVDNRTAISRAEMDGWVAEGVVEYHPPLADVRPAIADADVVVLPSYREGTSRVLLEAAAMARPLIATDVPGCREVVEDGITGLLCRVRDVGSLAEAMERMIALSHDERAAMGAAGRAKVESEFDERLVIDAYRREIARVLGDHP